MKKKLFRLLFICAICAAILSGCGNLPSESAAAQQSEKYSYTFDAFDTAITVTAYCDSQESFDEFLSICMTEYNRYHQMYDIYNIYPGLNNIKSINDYAGEEQLEVDPEIIDLLSFGKEVYDLTGGKVNIALGSVLRFWHDIREYNSNFPNDMRLPDEKALQEAAKHCNIEDIVIDQDAGTVYIRDSELRIDVGALAKGYATEQIAGELLEKGFFRFALNAGGNVRVGNAKPDGTAWKIGITDPIHPASGEYIGIADAENSSIVTSGSYQRFFTYEGKNYHHIIDPDSLQPENRYLSVTVETEKSDYADAMSTALFNMDLEQGKALVEKNESLEAMWILPDGSIEISSNFSYTS